MSGSSAYDPPFSVESFNAVPRFGRSDDLARVATGQDPWQDYAKGTVFAGAIILSVFVLWVILTGLFFCCGPRAVGILSGRKLREDNRTMKHGFYRLLVLGSCVCSLMSGMVFLVKVTSSLKDTFGSVRDGVTGVANVGRGVTSIVDQIIATGETTVPIRDTAIGLLAAGTCTPGGGNGVRIEFDDEAEYVIGLLTDLSDFTRNDLTVLRNSFDSQFIEAETEVNRIVDDAQSYARASYYAIVIMIFSFFLSAGAYAAWFGPRVRTFFIIQSWVVLPTYFLIIILTAIVTSVLATVLTVNSDVCMGGEFGNPESFITAILDTQNLDEYPRRVVDYYILEGCAGNFIGYDVVVELLNQLMDGNQAVIDIMALLAEKQANFELQCGQAPGSLDGLRLGLVLVNDAFSGFIFAAEDARNLLECQPINELYKDFFHDGVCGRLPNTLNWMFATMILVLAFGMVIFTLRGAMVPSLTKEQPEDYYHSKESERGLTRELAQVELKHGTDNDAEESVAPPQAEPVEEMNDDAPTSKESAGWFGSSFRSGLKLRG